MHACLSSPLTDPLPKAGAAHIEKIRDQDFGRTVSARRVCAFGVARQCRKLRGDASSDLVIKM